MQKIDPVDILYDVGLRGWDLIVALRWRKQTKLDRGLDTRAEDRMILKALNGELEDTPVSLDSTRSTAQRMGPRRFYNPKRRYAARHLPDRMCS